MRIALFIFLLLPSVMVYAQPSKEEIKKFKIRKVSEKRNDGTASTDRTWYYDKRGSDSIQQDGDRLTTYRNSYKNNKLVKLEVVSSESSPDDLYVYEYKPDGSYKETFTDGEFKMKSYEWYDSKGRLLKSQSPDGNTITYKYDAKGKLMSVTSDGKNGGVKISHKYSYNPAGRLIKVERNIDGNKTTTTYTYDAKGRVSKQMEKGTGWDGEFEMESIKEYNEKGLLVKVTEKNKSATDPDTVSTTTYEYAYEYW